MSNLGENPENRFSSAESHMSRVVRKQAFCICENKDADQLRGNREADQRLCFRYIENTIPLLSMYEISSLWQFSVAVQPSLCGTWSGFSDNEAHMETSVYSVTVPSANELSKAIKLMKSRESLPNLGKPTCRFHGNTNYR